MTDDVILSSADIELSRKSIFRESNKFQPEENLAFAKKQIIRIIIFVMDLFSESIDPLKIVLMAIIWLGTHFSGSRSSSQ